MGKKIIISLLTAVFLFTSVGMVLAGDKGNKRKGKYTYRKIYQACNERGEIESAKPAINPDSKTQAQWTRVFEKKDFEDFGCKEEWDKLSDQDLLDVFTYLHSGAADSPTPAKCK